MFRLAAIVPTLTERFVLGLNARGGQGDVMAESRDGKIADLPAHPSYRATLARHERQALPATFGGKIAQILEDTKYQFDAQDAGADAFRGAISLLMDVSTMLVGGA